eukprot:sb/3477399/
MFEIDQRPEILLFRFSLQFNLRFKIWERQKRSGDRRSFKTWQTLLAQIIIWDKAALFNFKTRFREKVMKISFSKCIKRLSQTQNVTKIYTGGAQMTVHNESLILSLYL